MGIPVHAQPLITMQITRTSGFTGKVHIKDLPITQAEIYRWQGGELIQNVWPSLSPDDREFLMTGVTAEEWEASFSSDGG